MSDSSTIAQGRRLRLGSLFTGYGGLAMAVEAALGAETVWVADHEPPTPRKPHPSQGAATILAHRFPGVPNLGDITAVDWSGVEPVDVIDGGSPCQDVSAAGKRAGMRSGTRSGLWASMCEAVDIIRPRFVVWENVRGVLSAGADSAVEPCPICVGDERGAHLRALGRVLGDLSELGYDAAWCGLRAGDVGAPHARFRVFVLAWPAGHTDRLGHERSRAARQRREGPAHPDRGAAADARGPRLESTRPGRRHPQQPLPVRGEHPAADPESHRRDERGPESARIVRGSDAAFGGASPGARPGRGLPSGEPQSLAWGTYTAAIHRWEQVLGRPAPEPTEPGPRGGRRLAPAFVEWMQGLPAGWVTDVPGLSRNDQLKALGNGVVPQQGTAAIRYLLQFAPAGARREAA